jgi:molybdopterin converting factor small subunit
MSARIKLSQIFKQLADNQAILKVNGNTVRECLEDLMIRYPATRNWVIDKEGSLISLVVLNGNTLRPKDLDISVTEADDIYLLTMIGGG